MTIDGALLGARLANGLMNDFIPAPKTNGATTFGNVMKTVGTAVTSAAETAIGIDPEYGELIQEQIQAQMQMQLVSMESNIEKSKHETAMAPIRNIRVG